jgi:hypothetical protein
VLPPRPKQLRKEITKEKYIQRKGNSPLRIRKVLQQEKYSTQGHLNIHLPGVENLFTGLIPPAFKLRKREHNKPIYTTI